MIVLGWRSSCMLAAVCALVACGGGGGSGAEPPVPPPVVPGPPAHVTFQRADLVIGQRDFEGTALNRNGPPEAHTLADPEGAAVSDDGRLFIADSGNNRILIYPAVPEQSDSSALWVVGQQDLQSNESGLGRDGFHFPSHVAIGAGKMAVVDYGNNRVLVYSNVPTESGTLADFVVGQPDFESEDFDCSDTGLAFPFSATITPQGKLIVSDTLNHRVLIWREVPTGDGQPATLVLGQEDFFRCEQAAEEEGGLDDPAPNARTIFPVGVWSDDKRLVVATDRRVMIWTAFPTDPFQPADLVLGQDDFTRLDLPLESGRSVGIPWGVSSDGVSLAVTDHVNDRILIWNTFPTGNGQQPDVVLGASDLKGGSPADGTQLDRTLREPTGVLMLPSRTLVLDTTNNRVLVFGRPAAQ